MNFVALMFYFTTLLIFICFIFYFLVEKKTLQKLSSYYAVSNILARAPRILSNLIYATNAEQLLERGYNQVEMSITTTCVFQGLNVCSPGKVRFR